MMVISILIFFIKGSICDMLSYDVFKLGAFKRELLINYY